MDPVPLPEVELRPLTAKAPLRELVAGKVAVIDLWATWCEPCRESIPKVVRLAAAYPEVAVIGIHVGEGEETAERFAREANIGYPLFTDPQFAFSDRVGSRNVPTLLIVDKAGRIVHKGTELDKPTLGLVRSLLAQ
jgi:thiol-disulfide isomerase/thioredoxin